jgi:integrase
VPLQPAAIALLGNPRGPHELVFPSPIKKRKPLSDATLAAVLARMKHRDITVHGFRSTFRDWAGETTAHAREVVEAALAHRLKDKAEAAYARGDLFQKRRKLMQDWADYLASSAALVLERRDPPPERAVAK